MDSELHNKTMEPTEITIEQLQNITNNFSEDRKIGEGTYGKVYVGVHENGEEPVAVKILHNNISAIDDEQFQQELKNHMRLEHPNIIRVVRYCYDTRRNHMPYDGETIFAERTYKALCLEYMQNGSLQKHLSDECDGLDWHTRYKIIKGTCEGLKYLHEDSKKPIYHLDLKPDNILLDKNMEPKLADFGLSKIFSEERTRIIQSPIGTIGYLPMEYLHENIVSNKLDIFSLGVIMIKVITGPSGHSRSIDMPYQDFLNLVRQNWRNRLQATWSSSPPLEAYCEQVNICMEIAHICIDNDRKKRPNIGDIIDKLNVTETMIDKALSSMPGDCQKVEKVEDGTNLVKVQAFTSSKSIPGAHTCNNYPVMVRITAVPRSLVEEIPLVGVDVVAVLDISRRMSGYRLERMKQAMVIVINKLALNDRLAIVSFDTNVCRLTELTYMSKRYREAARFKINELKALNRRQRDMGAALREGAEILRGREAEESSSRVGCMMLLSAGDCQEIYKQHISPEFAVHTFGLGTDHDPRVMKHIADKTSGTYSFVIQDIEKIKDAFELFISGLACVATHLKIILRVNEGVTISSIQSGGYGNLVSPDKHSGVIHIDSICAGDQKNFIIYLTVSKGKEKLVTVDCRYQSQNASKQLTETGVFVQRPCWTDRPSRQHEVAAELVRIQLAKGIEALSAQMAYGHYHYPTDPRLRELWTRIMDSEDARAAPKETLSDLGKDVDEMKREIESFWEYEGSGLPYMQSWLSSHKWQRATTKGKPSSSGAFQTIDEAQYLSIGVLHATSSWKPGRAKD